MPNLDEGRGIQFISTVPPHSHAISDINATTDLGMWLITHDKSIENMSKDIRDLRRVVLCLVFIVCSMAMLALTLSP